MSVLWFRKEPRDMTPRETQVGLFVDEEGDFKVIRNGGPQPLEPGGASAHDHDADYAALSHGHDAHAHPFAADDHTHPAGAHPDLATHEALGLSSDAHTHDFTHEHDADYAGLGHAHADHATDADLATHAGTAHGTSAHSISGVMHTGSLDHSALGSITPNQHHNQAHAIGGPDHTGSLSAADVGAAAAAHTHDYAADDHTHSLTDPDIPASIARDSEVTSAIATHAATPHGAGEAFPVGSAFISFVATNPASLLGYGTWAARGAGRVLIGVDAGQSGGELLGAATHGHTVTQPADHPAQSHAGATVGNHTFTQPTAAGESAHTHTYTQTVNHVHVENMNGATTGSLSGWGVAVDTSTNTPTATGYSTANPTGGVAQGTTAAGSSHTHSMSGGAVDAHSVGQANQHTAQSHTGTGVATSAHLPLAMAVYVWERTA